MELAILGFVGLLLFVAGRSHGRYVKTNELIKTYVKCACGEGNNIHARGGRGRCMYEQHESGSTITCMCKRFTPKEN